MIRMTRVTTSATLKNYRYNLMHASNNRNDAENTVLTGRNFNSYAEDPATASRCYQLRSNYSQTVSQYDTNKSVVSKYEVAWSSVLSVVDDVNNMVGDSSLTSIIKAENDPTAGGRNALGAHLEQMAENIVQTMNAKYGDNFVFAGADGLEVPFTWDADGNLCYRGINVSSSDVQWEDGAVKTNPATGEPIADEEGAANLAKLEYLSNNEKKFADIGLGMKEDGDELIESSAYNVALHGIDYLGYGVDEDGDPKNVACIIKRMGQILKNCDEDGYFQEGEREEFTRLFGKFETAAHVLEQKHTEMDTEAAFLKDNQEQLSTRAYTLQEQFLGMEDVDPAEAISAYSWAQYCYNAALKVGNSILSESLMDYLQL